MKAALEISQSRSHHLIRYMAQIPMPSEHFDSVLMEIQQMEHETTAANDTEIAIQQSVLRYVVTGGESVAKGELLELLVSHLGHHPEYISLARTVSEELYEDVVGARSVIAVAKRHPSDIASWIPSSAIKKMYPTSPTFVEWVLFWWTVSQTQEGAILPEVVQEVIERGGTMDDVLEPLIRIRVDEGTLDFALHTEVNGIATTLYGFGDRMGWVENNDYVEISLKDSVKLWREWELVCRRRGKEV